MIRAMNSSAMPTSGGVILSLRTRAAASCSAASVERNVEHFARQAARHGSTLARRERRRRGHLFEFDDAVVVGDELEGAHEALAGRGHLAHAPPELAEQQPVAGPGGLVEGPLVAGVAGQQHGDHVEIGTELMTQIDGDVGAARHGVGMHEQGRQCGQGQRERGGDPHSDRHHAGHLEHAEDERGQHQPDEGGEHEEPDVHVDRPPDQAQRLRPRIAPVAAPAHRCPDAPDDSRVGGDSLVGTGAAQVLHRLRHGRTRLGPSRGDQPRAEAQHRAREHEPAGDPHRRLPIG